MDDIELIGPGPYVMPIVKGIVSTRLGESGDPFEIVVLLEGGTEVLLPVRGIALVELWRHLDDLIQDE